MLAVSGIPFRYYGLATHANTLLPAGACVHDLSLALSLPFPMVNRFSWFLVTISLILSQSKTTITAAIVIGLFLVIYRYRNRLLQRHRRWAFRLVHWHIAFLCFSFSITILAVWFGSDQLKE